MTVVVRRDPLAGGFLIAYCGKGILFIADCHEGSHCKSRIPYHAQKFGPVAQLVRALPCHGRGQGFESLLGRLQTITVCNLILFY